MTGSIPPFSSFLLTVSLSSPHVRIFSSLVRVSLRGAPQVSVSVFFEVVDPAVEIVEALVDFGDVL
jgi:hypothetical protein